jgi:hypothetical protein
MSWLSFLEPIFGIIKEPVVEWQKRKTLVVENNEKVAERDHEIRVKKVDVALELAKQGKSVEAEWDKEAQQQMKTSWKDEWFVILFSIPLVSAFIPELQPYILKGFETLEKTPDWYMWLVVGIVSATFGLRWMFGKINLRGK